MELPVKRWWQLRGYVHSDEVVVVKWMTALLADQRKWYNHLDELCMYIYVCHTSLYNRHSCTYSRCMGVTILASPPSGLMMARNTPCRKCNETKKFTYLQRCVKILFLPNPCTEIPGYHDHQCCPGHWNIKLKENWPNYKLCKSERLVLTAADGRTCMTFLPSHPWVLIPVAVILGVTQWLTHCP